MRLVMARLVTVEQAARTANIPTERLARDLNAALGVVDDRPSLDVVAIAPNVAPSGAGAEAVSFAAKCTSVSAAVV